MQIVASTIAKLDFILASDWIILSLGLDRRSGGRGEPLSVNNATTVTAGISFLSPQAAAFYTDSFGFLSF
jgi:hypothetical protein